MWSDWLVICDCGFSLSALSCWRRKWHPTPLLLPGKSHGWRSLVGYNPWGCEELDTTERLHFLFWLSCIGEGNGNPLQCSCLESPRDGEPGGLPSMGSHRVGHNWSDLAAAALWCPLSVPTVLLGFLLSWTWGISSRPPLLTLDVGYLLLATPVPPKISNRSESFQNKYQIKIFSWLENKITKDWHWG